MQIIKGQPSDLMVAMAIIRACVARMREQGIEQWDEVYPDEKTLQADLVARTMYFAQDGAARAGIIVLNEDQPREYDDVAWGFCEGKILVVHRLAVDPAYQGKGVARQLMHFAEEYGTARGYSAIRLDAFVHNPLAMRLYRGLGYRQAGAVTFRKGVFLCYEKRLGAERPPDVATKRR